MGCGPEDSMLTSIGFSKNWLCDSFLNGVEFGIWDLGHTKIRVPLSERMADIKWIQIHGVAEEIRC